MDPELPEGAFIDGDWRPAAAGTLDVEAPARGETVARIARGGAGEIGDAVAAARAAADGGWGRWPAFERGRVLARLGALIAEHHEPLARLECLDTGKPISQARADLSACARYFEFYGGAADKLHGEVIPYQDGYTVMAVREPCGVVGFIIPWNYPAQIFGRAAGGALAAGNACVLKPAEDACLTVLRLTGLAHQAGLPAGALNVVPGLGAEAGAALSAHPDVDHLSFTGSPATGTRVAEAAARNHVPVTLELGGKSAQVVFDDADLDAVTATVSRAIVQNAGQTCSAGSRLLVQEGVRGELTERLQAAFSALSCGPGEADPDCGPLINARQKARLAGMLERGREAGMRVLAEGRIADDAPAGGHYVAPMLVTGVPPEHEVAQEELFGPVLTVFGFRDEAQALRLANGTPYGLVAGLWTRDGSRQLRLPRALKAGQVFVNSYGAGGGVELPFGGMKRSGYGREKGFEGMRGFTVLKTVTLRHG